MSQFLPISGALTGGSTGSLDSLYAGGETGYYSALTTGDIAMVYYNDRFYVYRFNVAGSAYTESSPTIIKPDNQSSGTAYSGNGAWLLVDAMSADLLSPLRQSEVSVTGATTATIGRMHVCSGTSADYTVTLPAVTGNAGKMIGFRMSSALTKLVTLDGDGAETIDGATTRVMWAGEAAILLCDGTGWKKIAGKTIPITSRAIANTISNLAGSFTATVIDFQSAGTDPLGMIDLANNRFTVKRSGQYNITVRFQLDGTSFGSSMARMIMNGVNNGTTLALTEVCNIASGQYPTPSCTNADTLTAGTYYSFSFQTSHSENTTDLLFFVGTLVEIPTW